LLSAACIARRVKNRLTIRRLRWPARELPSARRLRYCGGKRGLECDQSDLDASLRSRIYRKQRHALNRSRNARIDQARDAGRVDRRAASAHSSVVFHDLGKERLLCGIGSRQGLQREQCRLDDSAGLRDLSLDLCGNLGGRLIGCRATSSENERDEACREQHGKAFHGDFLQVVAADAAGELLLSGSGRLVAC
jgi:hypothetical protein